jgi:hypothetical protein
MEPFINPCVNDIVLVLREDREGDRIPREYRRYIDAKNYVYRARIVSINPIKSYNRVQPLPLETNITTLYFTRKGYKSKMFRP